MRVLLIAVLLVGCGDDSAPVDSGTDTSTDVGPEEDAGTDATMDAGFDSGVTPIDPTDCVPIDAANAVTAADGDEVFQGMLRFLCDTWDVEQLDEWPPAEFMLALMDDEPDVFGNQFESFGFIADPNDEFPVGFKRGEADPTGVHHTCALCHVGELPDGRVWLGAPNSELLFGAFRNAVNERWVAAGNASLVSELSEMKAEVLGPGRTNAESASYPQAVPADFPPYWNMGEQSHFNYLGTGREARTEIYFSIFTFGAGDPNDEEALVPFPPPQRTTPVVMFYEFLQPPEGPAEDPDLVAMGEALFTRERCNECHNPDNLADNGIIPFDEEGVERFPGDDDAFPEGTIATSALHRILIEEGGGDGGRDRLIQFIVRNRLAVGTSDGYRTSQLAGVWATAPYLHNGSVPTLEDLLRPADERPVTFERHGFTVDTTVGGNSNEGHEFGTDITDEERTALAAYLRTL